MNPEQSNPIAVGKRIAAARRARNISQDDAAKHLGMSRPTYVAKEQGIRPFKAQEIVAMADMLGRSVHDLVGNRAPVTEFAPQFRVTLAAQVSQEAVDEAVDQFKQVCNDYQWLEDLLKAPMPRYPRADEYDTRTVSPHVSAEDIAALERSKLNLGQGPLLNVLEVLESEVGLRVFVLPLREFRIAGMFVYTDHLGGCVLINGKHPPTRQAWSAAHEYAHYLTERYRTEVSVLIEYERKPRSEQFADLFAASFLMPAAGLRQRFNGIVQSRRDFTVADLCVLADHYGVSVEAMTRRLERLGCVKQGTWTKLSGSGFSGRPGTPRALGQLNVPPRQSASVRLPERYMRLAVQAFEQEHITEGQLARLLRCSRVEARETVGALTQSDEIDVASGTSYRLDLNVGATLDLAVAERD